MPAEARSSVVEDDIPSPLPLESHPMKSPRGAIAHLTLALCAQLAVVSETLSAPSDGRLVAPRIWDEKELATWALPIAGVNAMPDFYSEAEYYGTQEGDLRTYPVYHPDHEPAGYMDWLRTQERKPLV